MDKFKKLNLCDSLLVYRIETLNIQVNPLFKPTNNEI